MGRLREMTNYVKLLPLLITLVLLAAMPAAVLGQTPEYTVQIRAVDYTVNEDAGTVEITVDVSPSAPFQISVLLESSDGTAHSRVDYRAVTVIVTFPANTTTQTHTVLIHNDLSVEVTETFSVGLESVVQDSRVTVSTQPSTVTIEDDDTATVGLDLPFYRVSEGRDLVQVCCSILEPSYTCPVPFPFDIQLSTDDQSAGAPADFASLDTILKFPVCGRRQCISIAIADDATVEFEESFRVSLERTSALPEAIAIDQRRAVAIVDIVDNDAAIVDFESDEYTITEGGSLDIGVELRSKEDCPVDFGFDIRLGSSVPTGARPYISGIPSLVSFKRCDKNVLTSVSTSDIEATAELRFALEPPSNLDPRISIGQPTAAAYVVDSGGTTQAFETLRAAGNNNPVGIWSDGTTMWVADTEDDKIYAYDMATKARDAGKEFNTLASEGNNNPEGIWSNGTTMWVVDYGDDKIYAYDMATKARDADKEFNSLPGAGSGFPDHIWSDGVTMWVEDGTGDKLYAYNLASKARDEGKDFNTLIAAGNNGPEGIWSDGTTMWVADQADDKIYAYNLATKARDAEKDFNAPGAAGNKFTSGIWSDGTIMWVGDWDDDKIYAYYFPEEPVLPTTIRRPTTITTGVTSDTDAAAAARPSVIKPDLCVADIVDPDGGEIELGDTISDSWVGGCPSVTRGGRLAKYYTFDLPITTSVEIALDSHLDTYLVLRRGGLSGDIVVQQDDDDGPGNNSLISSTLKAGRYTIEATTFYADGVEADFTLLVRAVPRILYDGPVSDVAHTDYTADGPTMTVKLLPTLPMGTLEITVEDADGFGAGTGPLGGAQADGSSAGTVLLALPRTAWVQYGGVAVETRESGIWAAHTQADEQAMLNRRAAGPNLSPVLLGLVQLLGKVEGARQLLQSLSTLPFAALVGASEPDDSILDTIFRRSHANCVSQVTIPWLVDAEDTTGVRISVPMTLADTDYLSLAASFVASGNEPALAQLHDLLDTGEESPECEAP